MNIKDFMVNIYDLIANNAQYKPREQLDSMIAESIEDYWLDGEPLAITFVLKNGKRYNLTLIEGE